MAFVLVLALYFMVRGAWWISVALLLLEIVFEGGYMQKKRMAASSGKTDAAQPPWDPQQFVYVMIPGDIQPLARGERFEDPLAEALRAAGLGDVSGGGSQLDDPYPDGRPRVAFCGIDIDVVDRDRALGAIRQKLGELDTPAGTEVHYTVGATMLLDRLVDGAWQQRLPRTFKHPGFGV